MQVIATAGHVDHGKSTLVRALTGMEPDRWESEQQRGMTIDLGFAWMTLPSGQDVAFVDVPGHERFVSSMLAGVGPTPAVMFVVAADEGWMPQSAEHLAAIDALGITNGILVVTRADLADPAPALQDAALRLAATSLGGGVAAGDQVGVDAVVVSARTGAGFPELISALGALAARLPRPDPDGAVRLWLDRAFAIKGSGTVVTGTLQQGTVRAGDELVLTPSGRSLRIRAVQSLGTEVAQVSGPARVALNLRGISAPELSRGMALVRAGTWTLTSTIDVRLASRPPQAEQLPGQGPPGQRPPGQRPPGQGPPGQPARGLTAMPPQVTIHVGAARAVARVRRLGSHTARLTLDHPLPLHVGDRLLIRDPGARPDQAAGRPVLGATVLDVAPPRLRGNGAAAAADRELADWPEPPAAPDLLRRHRLLPASTAAAMGLRDLPPPVCGDWLADPAHWRGLRDRLAAAVAAHAASDPLSPGLSLAAASAELGLPDRRLVAALAAWRPADGAAEPLDARGGYLRHQALPAAVSDGVRTVLADLADAPFSAPDAGRLRELGIDGRAAAAAERAGLLLRLPGNVIVPADAADQAAKILGELPQPFSAAQARQALATTRRVVIPLLEWLDRQGVTRRLADDRRTLR